MRLALAFAAILFFGCADTVPTELNTTKWAKAQERVITGASCKEVEKFQPLRDAQHLIGPTNLTIRQDFIRSRCRNSRELYKAAVEDVQHLARNGYWPEYWSYWHYTMEAVEFADNNPRGVDYSYYLLSFLRFRVEENYAILTAPDGRLPLPETSDEQVTPLPGSVHDSIYFMKRWYNRDGTVHEYVLISLDTNPEPRYNFHHHPDFGYYAHWKNGTWLHRVKPYTGWDPKELTNEAQTLMVPSGPWSDPAWRANRTCSRTIKRTDSSLTLIYAGNDASGTHHRAKLEFYVGDSLRVSLKEGWTF